MKVAVIGAQGMLGRELCLILGTQHDIIAWDIEDIDITHRQETIEQLKAARPDLIVNSAVFVDLEGCETGKGLANQRRRRPKSGLGSPTSQQ